MACWGSVEIGETIAKVTYGCVVRVATISQHEKQHDRSRLYHKTQYVWKHYEFANRQWQVDTDNYIAGYAKTNRCIWYANKNGNNNSIKCDINDYNSAFDNRSTIVNDLLNVILQSCINSIHCIIQLKLDKIILILKVIHVNGMHHVTAKKISNVIVHHGVLVCKSPKQILLQLNHEDYCAGQMLYHVDIVHLLSGVAAISHIMLGIFHGVNVVQDVICVDVVNMVYIQYVVKKL